MTLMALTERSSAMAAVTGDTELHLLTFKHLARYAVQHHHNPHYELDDWMVDTVIQLAKAAELTNKGCPFRAASRLCNVVYLLFNAAETAGCDLEHAVIVKFNDVSERYEKPQRLSEPLTVRCFAQTNRERRLHGGSVPWRPVEVMSAAVGELGEAANEAKRLTRLRYGTPTDADSDPNESTEDRQLQLRRKFIVEVADTLAYVTYWFDVIGLDMARCLSSEIASIRSFRSQANRPSDGEI